ncbi:unnamed protein product, partial [Discosporangium mesarthrocarpum]
VAVSVDEEEELRTIFELFDCDRDGFLTQSEIREILWSLGQHPTEDDMEDMIRKHDTNGNGTLEFDEFKKLFQERLTFKNTREEYAEAFRAVDKNKDGKLSIGELNRLMVGVGCELTETELHEIFGKFDMDSDGRIDNNEFIDYMLSM